MRPHTRSVPPLPVSDVAVPPKPLSASGRSGLWRDIGVNAVLPYLTYLVLTRQGVATVLALTAGALFPAAAALVSIARERRVPALAIIVLSATAASIAGAVWFTNPNLLLAKSSLVTGVIGLVFFLSLLRPRPLVFYLVTTGRDAAASQQSEALWQSAPLYRHVMRRLTAIWAAALLIEASVRLLLIPLLPIAVFLPISEIMWIGFFTLMTAWSWRYGARMRVAISA